MRGITVAAWALVVFGILYLLSKGADSADNKPVYHNYDVIDGKDVSKTETSKLLNMYFKSTTEKHFRRKRSMAIGRTGWRPGKRFIPVQRWLWLPSDNGELLNTQKNIDRGQPEEVLPNDPQDKEYVMSGPLYWHDVPTWYKRNLHNTGNDNFGIANPICNMIPPIPMTPSPEAEFK